MRNASRFIRFLQMSAFSTGALLFFSLVFVNSSYAEIDKDLIGVWRNSDSSGRFIEFEITRDNRYLRWIATPYQSQFPPKFFLRKLLDTPIVESGAGYISVIQDGKKERLNFVVTQGGNWLEFAGADGQFTGDVSKQWLSVGFGQDGKASYKSHQNLAIEAEIYDALDSGDMAAIKVVLAKPAADFFRELSADRAQSHLDGESVIPGRVWDKVYASGNMALIKLFYEQAPIGAKTKDYLAKAMGANDVAKIEFYRGKLGYAGDVKLNEEEIAQYNFLHFIGQNLNPGQNAIYMVHPPFGCGRESVVTTEEQRKQLSMLTVPDDPEIKAQVAWARDVMDKQYDFDFLFPFVEEEFTRCLQLKFDKPVSLKVINTPSVSGVNALEPDTLLYRYAGWRVEQWKVATYAIIKALLDYGADPTIRPHENSYSLIEVLFANAQTEELQRQLESYQQAIKRGGVHKKTAESSREYKNLLYKIKAYNDIMTRIGGPAFAPGQTFESMAQYTVINGNLKTVEQQAALKPAPAAATKKNDTRTIPIQTSPSKVPAPPVASSTPVNPEKEAVVAEPFILPTYWHINVVPKTPTIAIPQDVQAMWKKGFFIELQDTGLFGFNPDTPSNYFYLPVNKWSIDEQKLTLKLDSVTYQFTLPKREIKKGEIFLTDDDQNHGMKMTLKMQ
ncbi:hypothetical protein NBRC116493_26110 [Aurantivibrio infirmus]